MCLIDVHLPKVKTNASGLKCFKIPPTSCLMNTSFELRQYVNSLFLASCFKPASKNGSTTEESLFPTLPEGNSLQEITNRAQEVDVRRDDVVKPV